MNAIWLTRMGLLHWKQDDSDNSETDGDEEDGSQSSTSLQAASRFHRYGDALYWHCTCVWELEHIKRTCLPKLLTNVVTVQDQSQLCELHCSVFIELKNAAFGTRGWSFFPLSSFMLISLNCLHDFEYSHCPFLNLKCVPPAQREKVVLLNS